MVIYFTGTGNSRYIAEELAKQLQDTAVDAATRIKEGAHPQFESEKPYVFVAPVYAWRMPRVFENWIRQCSFAGNQKAYFVLTCGGEIGAAGNYVEKFASECGFAYMGTAAVVMPDNYIVMFSPDSEEQIALTISRAEQDTAALCERVALGEAFDRVKIKLLGHLESGLVNRCFYRFYIGAKKFYATDACVSCGKCRDACMLKNITLKDGKPTWGKDCTHCMSCISKCPTEAIEYGKHTKGRRRYHCSKKI